MANSEWLRIPATYSDLIVGIRKSQINYFSLRVQQGKLTFEVDSSLICYVGGEESPTCLSYCESHWDLSEVIEFVREATANPVKAPTTCPAQAESIVADYTQANKPREYRDIVIKCLLENSYVTNLLKKRK